jgi:hypothetical protein
MGSLPLHDRAHREGCRATEAARYALATDEALLAFIEAAAEAPCR